jgi:hypothetical protein
MDYYLEMRCTLWSVSLVLLTSPSLVSRPSASRLEEEPNAGGGWTLKNCICRNINRWKTRRAISVESYIDTWKRFFLYTNILYVQLARQAIRSNHLHVIKIKRIVHFRINNPRNLMTNRETNRFASDIMGNHISAYCKRNALKTTKTKFKINSCKNSNFGTIEQMKNVHIHYQSENRRTTNKKVASLQ